MTMTAGYTALFLKILILKSSTTDFFEFFIHSTTCRPYKVCNVPAVVTQCIYVCMHVFLLYHGVHQIVGIFYLPTIGNHLPSLESHKPNNRQLIH